MRAELLLVVAILFAVLGFFKGAVREIFSVMGLLLAFFVAPFLTHFFILQSKTQIDQQNISLSVAIVGTLFYLFCTRVGRVWHSRNVQKYKIRKSLDHLLGALLGTLKGAALTLVVLHFLEKI